MSQGKTTTIMLVTLFIGFVAGFVLRPLIELTPQAAPISAALPAASVSNEARGTQYFVAHIDEARQVVAGCRDGSVRGGECSAAEEAIIKVDAEERRKRFLGN
jgi:hypothetical protein